MQHFGLTDFNSRCFPLAAPWRQRFLHPPLLLQPWGYRCLDLGGGASHLLFRANHPGAGTCFCLGETNGMGETVKLSCLQKMWSDVSSATNASCGDHVFPMFCKLASRRLAAKQTYQNYLLWRLDPRDCSLRMLCNRFALGHFFSSAR